MKQFDLMFCGHICLDLAPKFSKDCPTRLTEVFVPGKLVDVGAVDVTLGGSVSNSGAAASKLGLSVCVNAKVGCDSFGEITKNCLSQYQMEQSLSIGEGSTSYSVVLSVPGNDRIFLHHTGANDLFSPSDVDFEKAAGCRLFHFGYPPLMKKMYEQPELLLEILKKAKELGCVTSLDMALPDPVSPAGKANWEEILSRVLPFVDIYIPSFEETCYMLDRNGYETLRSKAAGGDLISVLDVSMLTALSDKLLFMGAGIVAIKCGLKGYYVRTASQERLMGLGDISLCPEEWADQEFICQALQAQEFVSSTGAGDSSISGFLCAVLKGKTPAQAAKSAVTTAFYCLKTVDASSGIPNYTKIEEVMEQKLPEISYMDHTKGCYNEKTGVWLMPRDRKYQE